MLSPLYEQIGPPVVADVIKEFYDRAFEDPIIGHFFYKKDKTRLVTFQTQFSAKLLGSKSEVYQGRDLKGAHAGLAIKSVHFSRRQVLMAEVLSEFRVPSKLSEAWLAREEALRKLMVGSESSPCR